MKQVLIKRGKAYSEEVPAPKINENTVLVQVYYSCISVGTEISRIKSSEESIMKRALRQSERVTKVVNNIKKEGLSRTIQKIQGKLEENAQTGYSASGEVIEVGSCIRDIKVSDRVACAGAGIANHAE
ncbi:hypothetical protein KA005_03975 [bacterium]|nr:hypothetical protein [bacterium]